MRTGNLSSLILFSSPGALVEISLSCKKKRGAALLLPVRIQREDTVARGEFAEWMVKHIDHWFSFAKGLHPGIERMEDIILVTGRHRTKSWANLAFIESQGPVRSGPMQVSLGVRVSGSPSSHVSVDWKFPREPGQGVVLNMGPSGEVRQGLPALLVYDFTCMEPGPICGPMRIYPRIPCHSHPPSIELVQRYGKTNPRLNHNLTTQNQTSSQFRQLLLLR